MIVTGASSGIGAAIARQAATAGFRVCVNYLHGAAAAQSVVEDIQAQGGSAFAVQADVGDPQAVAMLFRQADAQGRLAVLVNNAGILEKQSRVEAIDSERLARVFRTNVFGSFHCCREAVLRMSTRHGGAGGSIVNVSSAASRLGSPGEYVDYAASKGAMDSLTTGLSREVAAEGIRVNAVRPGFILTRMHALGGEPDRVERVRHTLPMGRGGTPEEVANAVLWLASPAASYVTGSFIDLAGGR